MFPDRHPGTAHSATGPGPARLPRHQVPPLPAPHFQGHGTPRGPWVPAGGACLGQRAALGLPGHPPPAEAWWGWRAAVPAQRPLPQRQGCREYTVTIRTCFQLDVWFWYIINCSYQHNDRIGLGYCKMLTCRHKLFTCLVTYCIRWPQYNRNRLADPSTLIPILVIFFGHTVCRWSSQRRPPPWSRLRLGQPPGCLPGNQQSDLLRPGHRCTRVPDDLSPFTGLRADLPHWD